MRPGSMGKGCKVNRDIVSPQVRLISEDGKMVGIVKVEQALSAAQAKGLDLIEVAPQAKPPTCKIMDYGKWKYENKKKASSVRKKQQTSEVKEIQIRVRTGEHDLETKLKNARRFLLDGDKVRINLRFSGRELAYQEIGFKVLGEVSDRLSALSNVEVPAKKEGRQLFVLLAPDAVKIKSQATKGADQDAGSKEPSSQVPASQATASKTSTPEPSPKST